MSEGAAAAAGDKSRRVYYVDLALGAWRPREAARQLSSALGLALAEPAPPPPSGAAVALAMLGEAATGDPLVQAAADDAAAIARALPGASVVVVLTPRFQGPLRAENEWLFFFLRQRGISVAIIGDEPALPTIGRSPFERRRSVVAPEWDIRADLVGPERLRLLALFPGLVPRAVAARFDLLEDRVGLLPAAAELYLIPTGYRTVDPRSASRAVDTLDEAEAMDEGMRAFGLCHCSSFYAEVPALLALARDARRRGSPGLAADLAARARTVARRPEEAAAAECARALVDLGAGHRGPPRAYTPSRRVPVGLGDEWRDLTRWTDLLSGARSRAETHMAGLFSSEGDADLRQDDLLALNAFSRIALAAGDRDRALGLARRVAAALTRAGDAADTRLVHANQLALARIARLAGDSHGAATAVERAFAPSDGARGFGEIVALNTLRADTAGPAAVAEVPLLRLRAALAWLALEAGEGIGRDAIEAVLGDPDIPRGQLEVNFCEVLADKLLAAWPGHAGKGPERLPALARLVGGGPKPERLFGAPGAAILWVAGTDRIPVYAPARARLMRAVLSILASLVPTLPASTIGTLFIDGDAGRDIPATRAAMLAAALRHGLQEATIGGERVVLATAPEIAAGLTIRISPAILHLAAAPGAMRVAFRWRHGPRLLVGDEARIAAALADGRRSSLADLAALIEVDALKLMPVLRRMEAETLLRLELPET